MGFNKWLPNQKNLVEHQSINNIQSNLVNTDTENAIESVRIKPVEFREIARAFNPRRQSELSVIMRCPY